MFQDHFSCGHFFDILLARALRWDEIRGPPVNLSALIRKYKRKVVLAALQT